MTATGGTGQPRTGTGSTVGLDGTDAWIFDLDGVLTDTARLHERAWADQFAALFASLATPASPSGPRPFTGDDYRRLVDGEARRDGVRHVLADRRITLPEGTPEDPAGSHSVWGIANGKDARYLELLASEGPHPFESSLALLGGLKASGIDVGVVSASRHCAEVLEAAGLSGLVDARVDGITAGAMGLAGKPDPATFLEAARRLGVEPSRAVVVEDALAGVEAGRRGSFAVVIGVDRAPAPEDPARAEDLRRAGADIVVRDLADLTLTGSAPAESPWRLTYEDPAASEEGVIETLCTLANGYVGTRGARPWSHDDGTSYPGTYLAGVYNRLRSDVAEQVVEMESMVNAPNWLATSFRPEGGPWLGTAGASVSSHRVRLDLRSGTLVRRCTVTDPAGRRTAVVERRLVSMADPHLAALELTCVPLNWSGTIELRAGIDGGVVDDETVEDRLLANRHLQLVDQGADGDGGVWLRARTVQSQIIVAMAARCRLFGTDRGPRWTSGGGPGAPEVRIAAAVPAGGRATIEKVVSVFTSRDRAISEPGGAARQAAADSPPFDELLASQRSAWEPLWKRAAFTVRDDGQSSTVLALHLFHLMQVASPHVIEVDAGLGARGLHGEGYRGHVFWDTLFAFPVLGLRFPEVSRALLAYRSRRLPQARRAAAEAGREGAMFPWQSGSDGREETPTMLFNPRSGRWIPDRSRFQRHVGLAIAYDAWQHWQITGDLDFIGGPGAELVLEVARFFASLATWDPALARYRIEGVVGPDEFHDGYPWTEGPGITDNAYTNVMASWLLWRAGDLADLLAAEHRTEIPDRLGVDAAELARWDTVSRNLHVPFHDGVISQFAGYERLEPIDLDAYRDRYGNIGRLDLILDSEGDAVRRYQVSKQADVLMLLYLLSAEELRHVLARMGYPLEPTSIRRTVDYYAARATHGSTLSRVVHSWVLARADRQGSWQHLQEALAADIADTQGGTTRDGIHLGAMAGTADILQRCYGGLEVRDEALWLHPVMPAQLTGLSFHVWFRGGDLRIDVDPHRARVEAGKGRAHPITLMLSGEPVVLRPGQLVEVAMGSALEPNGPGAGVPGRPRWQLTRERSGP